MKLYFLKNSIQENLKVHNKIIDLQNELDAASKKIFNTFKNKKKFLFVGMVDLLQTRSI